jgi:hypothetical protein
MVSGQTRLTLLVHLPDLPRIRVEYGQPATAVAVGVDADQMTEVEDLWHSSGRCNRR